ncbi:MAG: peptidoglycan-binding protein, partial [Pseudomonadota bacterium]|nr:peptidoglycan-binding protein [Pseudomonadota bacterium]
ADLRGLSGEETVSRLSLDAMPGDMGGPVFDATGAVLGVLVPAAGGARSLPGDVSFAATVPAIAEFLSANGLQMSASDNTGALDPADLAARAADMTVLVSCWN